MVKVQVSDEVQLSIVNRLLDEMKVFTMNDCDKVAALTSERAIKFYSKETGFSLEEVQEDFEGEVDKYKSKMYFPVSELTPEELTVYVKDETVLTYYGGMLGVSIPYDVVIRKEKKIYPYIISSTEY